MFNDLLEIITSAVESNWYYDYKYSFGSMYTDTIGSMKKPFTYLFTDVAIGAPYENNEGAVYIFNGKETKMDPVYSQKIFGSQLQDGIQGFGFYISRTAKDLDDNQYNGKINYCTCN